MRSGPGVRDQSSNKIRTHRFVLQQASVTWLCRAAAAATAATTAAATTAATTTAAAAAASCVRASARRRRVVLRRRRRRRRSGHCHGGCVLLAASTAACAARKSSSMHLVRPRTTSYDAAAFAQRPVATRHNLASGARIAHPQAPNPSLTSPYPWGVWQAVDPKPRSRVARIAQGKSPKPQGQGLTAANQRRRPSTAAAAALGRVTRLQALRPRSREGLPAAAAALQVACAAGTGSEG
jgi:hypothetical protein